MLYNNRLNWKNYTAADYFMCPNAFYKSTPPPLCNILKHHCPLSLLHSTLGFALSPFPPIYPITTFPSSGNPYDGTSKLRGAGPFRTRPEMS